MRYLLFATTTPFFVTVSLPLVPLLKLFGLIEFVRMKRDFIIVADITKRGARIWNWSTTLGRLILIHPEVYENDCYEQMMAHEMVHVRQHEDLSFIAWQLTIILGPLLPWWASLLLWWSSALWPLLMYIAAGLRYGFKNCYEDAEHERAAYAQTEGIAPWLTRHEMAKGRLP